MFYTPKLKPSMTFKRIMRRSRKQLIRRMHIDQTRSIVLLHGWKRWSTSYPPTSWKMIKQRRRRLPSHSPPSRMLMREDLSAHRRQGHCHLLTTLAPATYCVVLRRDRLRNLNRRIRRVKYLLLRRAPWIRRRIIVALDHAKCFGVHNNNVRLRRRRAHRTHQHQHVRRYQQPFTDTMLQRLTGNCRFCSSIHLMGRQFCPAADIQCFYCSKLGHLSKMCRSRSSSQSFAHYSTQFYNSH